MFRWPFIRLLPREFHIDFVRLAPFAAVISALCVAGSVASYAVLGGAGAYAGVRGDAQIVPVSATRSRISMTYTRLRDGAPETPVIDLTDTRTAAGGVTGGVVLSQIGTARGRVDSKTRVRGTFDMFTSTTVPVGGASIAVIAARYELPGGAIIVGGVGRAGEQTDLVILGGNSEYAGSRGSIRVAAKPHDARRLTFTMWRGGVGPAR